VTLDDTVPVVLVVLDGLGDRPSAELGGRTPAEAADTPVLDALAARGASGVHVPFGPGRATSSEVSHWSMFGYEDVPFPGRAALEGLGVGVQLPLGVPVFHLALRSGDEVAGTVRITGRVDPQADREDEAILFAALEAGAHRGVQFSLLPLRTGERLLVAEGARSHEVSDSDPLFDHLHPWLRPLPLSEASDREEASRTADALERWLTQARGLLSRHPVNRRRVEQGRPALAVPVTKWPSLLDGTTPTFVQRTGVRGGAVTSSALYRGLARLLEMSESDLPSGGDPGDDVARRLLLAEKMLGEVDVVHVHTKAPDEAGHLKSPRLKQRVIEDLDRGLAGLLELADHAIVAVTGDHATPSVSSLLHSGDPTPFVVAGPGVRADAVQSFGEMHSAAGSVGTLGARDVLPLLVSHANRPFFRGHRPGPWSTVALPTAPMPMPVVPS